MNYLIGCNYALVLCIDVAADGDVGVVNDKKEKARQYVTKRIELLKSFETLW